MKLAKAIINLATKTEKFILPLGLLCWAFYLMAVLSPTLKEVMKGPAIGVAISAVALVLLRLASTAIRAYGPEIE